MYTEHYTVSSQYSPYIELCKIAPSLLQLCYRQGMFGGYRCSRDGRTDHVVPRSQVHQPP